MLQISHQKKKMRLYYMHKILVLFFSGKGHTRHTSGRKI